MVNMDRYIKRDDVYALFEQNGTAHLHVADIDVIQDADVAPGRHGRWECGKPCPVCGRDRFEGLDADIWADWEPPYCPNCGALMDLES